MTVTVQSGGESVSSATSYTYSLAMSAIITSVNIQTATAAGTYTCNSPLMTSITDHTCMLYLYETKLT